MKEFLQKNGAIVCAVLLLILVMVGQSFISGFYERFELSLKIIISSLPLLMITQFILWIRYKSYQNFIVNLPLITSFTLAALFLGNDHDLVSFLVAGVVILICLFNKSIITSNCLCGIIL